MSSMRSMFQSQILKTTFERKRMFHFYKNKCEFSCFIQFSSLNYLQWNRQKKKENLIEIEGITNDMQRHNAFNIDPLNSN